MYPMNVSFIGLMNRLLRFSQHLTSFRLTDWWNTLKSSYVKAWIDGALKHNLECFEVNFFYEGSGIVFPCCLLNSPSLKKLNLSLWPLGIVNRIVNVTKINIVANNCAPNLTRLYLAKVDVVNGNPSSSTITFNYPVLETLTFSKVRFLNVKSVEIYAPSLTEFESYSLEQDREDNIYDYSMTLVAPKLTTFSGSLGLPETFIVNGASVSTVSLSHGRTHDPQLCKTIGFRIISRLSDFSGLEELQLSTFSFEVIQLGSLKRFDKLSRLRLPGYSTHAAELLRLLHAMPLLKFLYMTMCRWNDYAYEDMASVPSCIISHLEEVLLCRFENSSPHYNFVGFLMKTAEQMNCISIYCNHRDVSKVESVLSTYHRCSPSLTVNVIEEDDMFYREGDDDDG